MSRRDRWRGDPEVWQEWRERRRHWRRMRHAYGGRPRFIFTRFTGTFGLIILFIIGGFALGAYAIGQIVNGQGGLIQLAWLALCSTAFALPVIGLRLARSAFRNIATPLSDVMSAADAVADGDLSVRVPDEQSDGEFARLARSFNRMVAELERTEQQRRNLTADVAHELRNPLHILQGNIEGLLDGVYQPTEEQFNAMLEETQLLSRLVEDLQTLSLAESGALAIKAERVSLQDLFEDVQTSFSGQAAASQVELTIEVQPPSLTVNGDPDRLDQVLSNLVANALRYTQPGGHIDLAARSSEEGVEITVSDDGAGIPEEDLPFIFDRFWRADKARSRQDGSGAGLGLAIVRQLVQAHGGHIEVDSAPGEGTRFSIWLPAA